LALLAASCSSGCDALNAGSLITTDARERCGLGPARVAVHSCYLGA
jgi:hypothetical protein